MCYICCSPFTNTLEYFSLFYTAKRFELISNLWLYIFCTYLWHAMSHLYTAINHPNIAYTIKTLKTATKPINYYDVICFEIINVLNIHLLCLWYDCSYESYKCTIIIMNWQGLVPPGTSKSQTFSLWLHDYISFFHVCSFLFHLISLHCNHDFDFFICFFHHCIS